MLKGWLGWLVWRMCDRCPRQAEGEAKRREKGKQEGCVRAYAPKSINRDTGTGQSVKQAALHARDRLLVEELELCPVFAWLALGV